MFVCQHCDAQFAKWSGRCLECGSWGTIQEETMDEPRGRSLASAMEKRTRAASSRSLKEIAADHAPERIQTGDPEIDRVLGNGMVRGSLILLSGEPGIGKSTLVAKIASSIERRGIYEDPRLSKGEIEGVAGGVLYISGEESSAQLAARFARLKKSTESIRFLDPYPIETLAATIEKEEPQLTIIDSIQTMTSSQVEGTAGSPTLVRYATSLLLDLVKRTNVSILLVGQITKDGSIAGPKTLEHLVDVVLNLEGDPVHRYRILRASKNRFGATDEIGVFEMTEQGLNAVTNPSQQFLAERASTPGSVIAATMEGSRAFLVEVQALIETAFYGTPVRRASGFDPNRLQMLVAILSKRAGLKLGDKDVYLNVIGGMTLREPAADLAVCAAIVSAFNNRADETATVYIGEVGLGGEVRGVPFVEKRLIEAARLGLTMTVIPATIKTKNSAFNIRGIGHIKEL